jgi:hypothetical protein
MYEVRITGRITLEDDESIEAFENELYTSELALDDMQVTSKPLGETEEA